MTQISRPQQGLYATYPDAGGYTANQWARILRLQAPDYEAQGVFAGYLAEMAVTEGAANTIRVVRGAALVNGHYCLNENQTDPGLDSTVIFAPATPIVGDRIDRVVVVQNNTDFVYATNLAFPTDLTDYATLSSIPPHSCRLAILLGVDGGAARALVQNVAVDGNIWMIALARYTISIAPAAITAVTDNRYFIPARQARKFFVPAVGGFYTGTPYVALNFVASSTSVQDYGLILPDNEVSYAIGNFAVPVDYKEDMTVTAVILYGAPSGDIYNAGQVVHGGCAESVYTTQDALGYQAEATITLFRNCVAEIEITNISVGDMMLISYIRGADNVLDTINDDVQILGWLVEYTAVY